MIPFNIPLVTGKEMRYVAELLKNRKFCGDGAFTDRCNKWLEKNTKTKRALLTTSCTHALEMAAILANIGKDDEVIMPSYTFVSTANAFVLRGAKIVFVDIRPDTMNIDETKIESSVTKKTKAIVVVHYAGVSCEMDVIMKIAAKFNLLVIEDAAQGVMASYKGRALGSIGHIGCYSFHETKNYHCGEGGAILLNDSRFIERSEIVREKGTNRKQFLRGKVCKYTWVDIGSSYLPSELNAAFLFTNLEIAQKIREKRLKLWKRYRDKLSGLQKDGLLELPNIPAQCRHNAHTFYIKLKDKNQRQDMIDKLRDSGIQVVFHYVPLHTSVAGKKFGRFSGKDLYTTKESERILRLPLYFDLKITDVDYIAKRIREFVNG